MGRVFISYSRHNAVIVTQLIHDLQAVGIDTWYDQSLTGGQRWWDNILSTIRECSLYVFALSPESLDSEACKSELNYALRLGKPIIPVMVANGVNINLLSPPLNEIQIMDYRQGNKEAVFALVKSIYAAPISPSLPEPLPAPPPIPISYLSTLKERIDSPEPLSSKDQISLFFELEEDIRDGRSSLGEIRDLLLRLKRREDLLAKISNKIDVAVKNLEEKANFQPRVESTPNAPTQQQTYQEKEVFNNTSVKQQRFCPQCGQQAEPGQRFCGSCGAPLGEASMEKVQDPEVIPQPSGDKMPMDSDSKIRRFTCTSRDTLRIITDVKGWLDAQNFDTQQMNMENQGILLQIKKRGGGWRDFIGMGTSLNILFHHSGNTMIVRIGAGKWIDKIAAGAASLILWPLLITAGLGAWEQMKMPEKIFNYIETRLAYP